MHTGLQFCHQWSLISQAKLATGECHVKTTLPTFFFFFLKSVCKQDLVDFGGFLGGGASLIQS